ncbi:PGF-pre-PGF domain-containing protein [uncultured Methanoregula sp.]|uniref:PGF-pre-PGF domain-containing protein n=1 Tax=uncultured Methanoregula sp. TaxID=1005933 RepID=UPI002AAAB156|nr:PGF-pre-PGF domain-containing protein [uncultured Methanoregula sp.]
MKHLPGISFCLFMVALLLLAGAAGAATPALITTTPANGVSTTSVPGPNAGTNFGAVATQMRSSLNGNLSFSLVTRDREKYPNGITPDAMGTLEKNTRASLSTVWHTSRTGIWTATQPDQMMGIRVSRDGNILITGENGSIGMQLAGLGRDQPLTGMPVSAIRADGTRLDIIRDDVTEWYVNGNTGIEQGMTIATRPGGTGMFQATYVLSGTLRPADLAGQAIIFSDRHGPVIVYGGLAAKDATGRALPASMTLNGNQLTWQIDDRDAVYPLTIDPQVVPASSATAFFPGGASNDQSGTSVALSSDGTLALVSAAGNSTSALYAGTAYLFSKPSGGWSGTTSASAANATFTGGAKDDSFGNSVALSSDGTLVLVGANYNDTAGSNAGTAYLFSKPSGGWSGTTSASAANATFTGGAKDDEFGYPVALSPDGTLAFVGARFNDTAGSNAGAAYLFSKPSGGWSGTTPASAANATFTGSVVNDYFGYFVTLSPDGTKAVVGAPWNDTAGSDAGTVYLFSKPSGGWSGTTPASAANATFTGGAAFDHFGYFVALSSDGTLALVGAPCNDTADTDAGTVYLFSKPSGGWSGTTPASAANATFTGDVTNNNFGVSVALSSDGTKALAGASQNGTAGTNAGAAYLFSKPSGGWSGTTSVSAATETFTGGASQDQFGSIVTLLPDGTLALVGAQYNATSGSNAGAAYLYSIAVSAPTVTGISPTSGTTAGGTSVTVTGTGFTGATAVKFGSANAASYTVNSDTTITATSPVGSAGTVDITVTTATGTSATSSSDQFTYTAAPTPTPTQTPGGGSSSDNADPGRGTASAVTLPGVQAGQAMNFQVNQPVTSREPGAIIAVAVVPSRSVGPTQLVVADVGRIDTSALAGRETLEVVSIDVVGMNQNAVSDGTITFAVSGAWLTAHGATPADIVLMHNHDGTWAELPTALDHVSGNTYYFVSTTPTFSYFAITTRKTATTGNVTAIVTGITTPVVTITDKKVNGTALTFNEMVPATTVTASILPTTLPVTASTTAVPAPVAGPAGAGSVPAWLIGAGIAIIAIIVAVGFLVRRWWIRRQNPALFRKSG